MIVCFLSVWMSPGDLKHTHRQEKQQKYFAVLLKHSSQEMTDWDREIKGVLYRRTRYLDNEEDLRRIVLWSSKYVNLRAFYWPFVPACNWRAHWETNQNTTVTEDIALALDYAVSVNIRLLLTPHSTILSFEELWPCGDGLENCKPRPGGGKRSQVVHFGAEEPWKETSLFNPCNKLSRLWPMILGNRWWYGKPIMKQIAGE